MPQSINIPRVTRAAAFSPSSANEADRTVEVVWTTGALVRRYDWLDGEYEEVLDVTPDAIDLTRLNNGAPVLTDHECYEIDSVCGVVERAWIENGEGKALVRFAKDPESDTIWQKVKDGILRCVSVGYDVLTYQEIIEEGKRLLRATKWMPMELSFVAIPADIGAQVRSQAKNRPCTLIRAATPTGESEMVIEDTPAATDAATPATEPAEPAAPAAGETTEPAAPAEGDAPNETRALEIIELCEIAGVGLQRAREMVKSGKAVSEIRSVLLAERATRSGDEISTQMKPAAAAQGKSSAERMKQKFSK